MSAAREERAVVDAAAQWMALLHSGHASPEELEALAMWRASDARHEKVFQRMSERVGRLPEDVLRQFPRQTLLHSLQAPSSRRKVLRTCLGFAAAALLFTGVSRQRGWTASGDVLQTSVGERRRIDLPDGSVLVLNARTRLESRFDASQRLIVLERGSLWLDVGRDAQRPFVVETVHGRMRALGTRFMVERLEDRTQLTMLHSRVLVETAAGVSETVEAGRNVVFDRERIFAQRDNLGDESAWLDGRLEARDWPLRRLVERLRDYRSGIITLDEQVADLHLSGIYPLDDSDHTLQLLERSLPIRVTYHSRYWVSIAAR